MLDRLPDNLKPIMGIYLYKAANHYCNNYNYYMQQQLQWQGPPPMATFSYPYYQMMMNAGNVAGAQSVACECIDCRNRAATAVHSYNVAPRAPPVTRRTVPMDGPSNVDSPMRRSTPDSDSGPTIVEIVDESPMTQPTTVGTNDGGDVGLQDTTITTTTSSWAQSLTEVTVDESKSEEFPPPPPIPESLLIEISDVEPANLKTPLFDIKSDLSATSTTITSTPTTSTASTSTASTTATTIPQTTESFFDPIGTSTQKDPKEATNLESVVSQGMCFYFTF